MNEDLKAWANRVIDTITPYAEKIDKDFYPLQSPAKANVDVLFLGLNPGGGYSYDSQKNNPQWEFSNGMMSQDRLLNGNPDFNNALQNWSLFKGLKQIPFIKDVISEDKYILTNYYYLSTKSFDEVLNDPTQIEVVNACKRLTIELIGIIQPKIIIVLGTSTGLDKLPFANKKTVLNGINKRLLMSAEFEGINVYAIPHPSTLAITKSEVDALNTNLTELIAGKSLTSFFFKREVSDQFSAAVFHKVAIEQSINLELAISDDRNTQFKLTVCIGEDNLLIKVVLKPNEKYLAIRDANASTKGISERFYIDLENPELYISQISEPKIVKQEGWLVKKNLKTYKAESVTELYNAILSDIESISNLR